jgi:carboxyl-terminal processing protease
VVPDVAFPSLYDPEEIGESALDHALNWDQINPVRHHRYNDLSSVVPRVTAQFVERSAGNPDFVYLEEQVELARQTREITEVPLNEQARIALRESQEDKALIIENKRRKALGEPLLTSLDEDEATDEDAASDDTEEEEQEDEDVLLVEAGNILVDVLTLKQRAFAVNTPLEAAK